MQLRTLEPCIGLWGRADLLDGLPRIKVVENAIYLPWSHGGPWGIFDAEGRAIRESLNLRTIEGLPSGPQPSFPAAPPRIVEEKSETYLYLGLLNTHYGHFIVNSFARLWPLVLGRARLPRLVWHTIEPHGSCGRHEFLTTILGGLGTGLDDIACFDVPVRFKRLLVPETSFQEQLCVYPVFRVLASRVGTPLYDSREVDSVDRPVFLSKTHLASGVGCFEDEQVIEDTLRAGGVDIVHPQDMPFAEQVRLFARRRCILATSGSALHTSIFGPPRRRIVSLNPMREVNSNFKMIDRLNRNEIAYFCPRGMTYSSSPQFLTRHRAPDPGGVGEDMLTLAWTAPKTSFPYVMPEQDA